jgi:CIC family chloride channel protein
MQTEVKTVGPESTVAEAVVSLSDAHVTALPVIDRTGRMLGVVSSSDILSAEAEAEDAGTRAVLLDDTPVRDIMTPRPLTISPDADVREAARQMLYADVHRLFVAADEKLIGVISGTDIVRAVATGKL